MTHQNTAPICGATAVLALFSVASFPSYAQQYPQETELSPITVSAHRGLDIPRDATGASVSVLDVPALQKQGIHNLAEALTGVPGVSIQPGGGANQRGNVANTAIRGMSSDTATLPVLDGMRIFNTGGSGLLTANTMARTDLFSLGNVEILKGSQGACYGGGAMGGVIFMETPKGEGAPSLSLFQEAGSHSSYTARAAAQGQQNALRFYISSSYSRTDNDISFANGMRPAARNGGEYESFNEALRLDWEPTENQSITLTYRREDSEYGYTGLYHDWYNGGIAESYYRYNFRTNLLTLKWTTQLHEQLSSSLMAGYYGYDATLGSGYCQDLRNIQLEWRNAWKWCPHQTTSGGFAWNRSAFSVHSSGQTIGTDANLENTYAFFAEHIYSPVEYLSNSVAARLELSNLYDPQFTVRAASSYRFNDERSRLTASAGTGYRAPGSFQRSNSSTESWGTTYHGNPDLKVEHSISADIGLEHDIADGHTLSITGFWQRRENAITTVYTSPTDATYRNDSGHWTILGAELALQGTIEQAWNTGYKLAWTYTSPKTADGSQIPWTSRQTWSAELHTTPIEGFTTGIGLVAAAGRSNFEGNSPAHIDSYYSLRWFARYQVNENLTLHLRVENITNQKFVTEGNFSPDCSMLSPGTAVYGGCTLEF